MLYINTKNRNKTYTAYQAFSLEPDTDGGMIAPLRLPSFNKKELSDVYQYGFCGAALYILNKFFSKTITAEKIGTVIDFGALSSDLLDRKTVLIGFDGKLKKIEECICSVLLNGKAEPTLWAKCAIRISLLFGVFAELARCGIAAADFAVVSDDTLSFIPVLYCKLMGLPVNKIIAGAANEDAVWNYVHKLQEGAGDVYEYFIHGISAAPYITADLFSFVVSSDRAREIITNVQSTYKKSIDLNDALSYGALQDYRAITGENHTTIVFSN